MIVVASQNVITFRQNLIRKFISIDYQVSVIAFDREYEKEIKELNVDFYCIEDNNRSTNPLKIMKLKKRYYAILKQINPDIVFTFQLKPNLFGTTASKRLTNARVYSMVEGVGDVFIKTGFKWKMIKKYVCHLYKKAFEYSNKVFFLNEDDEKQFIKLKLVKAEKAVVINGIGVDLDKFEYKPIDVSSNSFVMIARMLRTKGVFDYCKCAEIVRKTHPEAKFLYLGAEGDVKIADIKKYIDNGDIYYIGSVKDVRPYVEQSLLVLLSSYREGKPMSIMEAESIGRGIITTNVVGCKDTVVEGYNGYLVDEGDCESMARHCIDILENKELAVEFGINSRKYAEENYDQKKINDEIISIVNC